MWKTPPVELEIETVKIEEPPGGLHADRAPGHVELGDLQSAKRRGDVNLPRPSPRASPRPSPRASPVPVPRKSKQKATDLNLKEPVIKMERGKNEITRTSVRLA